MVYLISGTFACPEGYAFFYLLCCTPEIVITRFCRAVDEVGNFLRPQTRIAEFVSLRDRGQKFVNGVEELQSLFQAV